LLLAMLACNLPGVALGPSDQGEPPTPRPAAAGQAISTAPAPSEHRIAVRSINGSPEFYDRVTGQKFVPRGAALWRWRWVNQDQQAVIDTIFNTSSFGQLDSALTELPKMHADGFNTVRLWFNACWGGATGCLDQTTGGLNRGFLENMARFMQVARENGIYIILTMDALPDSSQYQGLLNPYRGRFEGFNLEFMTQGGVDAQVKYQTDLIRGLMEVGAPMDAIMAYQLKEEAYFEEDQPPLNATSGNVTPANGRSYNLADPAQRRMLMEDSWLYYIDQVTRAIKAVDPSALVTMGFFVQHGPNPVLTGDPRIVYMAKVLNESALDYVSFSAYPGYDLAMKQTAENFDLIGYDKKPVVMGEYGADKGNYADLETAAFALQAWQVASCEFGFDGWQMWYWGGGDIHFEFWEALEGSGEVRRALSPALNPDPCLPGEAMRNFRNMAIFKPVRASATHDLLHAAEYAVDLSMNTHWNAGANPPNWIEIDLQQPSTIGAIRLPSLLSQTGFTRHRILGKGETGDFQVLHEFSGVTQDGQWLEYRPSPPLSGIRWVRIETLESPSWVAWQEIEILKP
jgi:hypothetical protein